mmetsp:Transcript_25251/g.45047  ORF Transcript_25251/g.45047 Transcript_25251/m.45047 type:complete len:237 (+) Transcript_25251:976-1686(+)
MEVAGEPALDLRVGANGLDKLFARHLVVVVQPAAAINDVALLQHAQRGADNGRVAETKDGPAILLGVCLHRLHKPFDLRRVHRHLVRSKLRRPKLSRAQPDYKYFRRNFVAKLRRLLSQNAQVRREVFLVRLKLVDTLQVMVSTYYVVLGDKAVEVVANELEAVGCSGVKLLGLRAVLAFTQIAEGNEEGVWRVLQDGVHVVAALVGVRQVARVDVQIAQDGDGEVGRVVLLKHKW